jgi:hypothetical protein
MNYEEGVQLLPSLERLKDKTLLKSNKWDIIHIALLPIIKDTLLAYAPVLDGYSNGQWLANGVNHEIVYKRTGIYYRPDGSHFDDNLNFYAILKKRDNPLHVEYKCELLTKLIVEQEIKKEDIPSFVLSRL